MRCNRGVGPAQLPERFEYREVRLARAVMLYALPTRACDVTEARNEVLDERGLADSRLAGDPDDGALPANSAVPCVTEAREFPQAPDEGCSVRFTGERVFGSRRVAWGLRGRHRQRRSDRDEAIAAARDGFDVSWLARIVDEHGPKIADCGLQHRVADVAVAPDLIEQGVLGQ